jgi:hypothetical protein
MSLKSHFLFICCNMFRSHKANIRRLLVDQNHHTAWTHTSVYLHAILHPLYKWHARSGKTMHRGTQCQCFNTKIARGRCRRIFSNMTACSIACKYIDVWAHAVQWFRSINGCLMMTLWGWNSWNKQTENVILMTFMNFECDCKWHLKIKRVCVMDGSEWMSVIICSLWGMLLYKC